MNAVSSPTAEPQTAPSVAEAATGAGARLQLRVLSGRSKGASHNLPANRRIMIGHSFENDIVLRDAGSRGFSVFLTPHGKLASLEVVTGSFVVMGKTLVAGEEIMLEPYVPVRFSGFVFAVGGDNEDRWLEAQEIAASGAVSLSTKAEAAPATNITERIELRTQPVLGRYGNLLSSPLALLCAAALLLVVAGGTFFGANLLGKSGPSPSALQSELAALGYSRLGIERAQDGESLSIVGLVPHEDDLLRLKAWSQTNYPDVTLGVATLQSAAEAADNLLAAQNVDADVRVAGVSELIIETEFLPRDRQAELEALLKRDLPRVQTFTFSASAARGESDLAYFFNAPGYGAASFVSGDPGYIVTEDGTRWFTGAKLPTGHTILEIKENSVTVEREGLRDTLIM